MKRDVARIDRQIEQILNRIMESSSTTVISAFEKRVETLEHEKLVISDQLARGTPSKDAYTGLFELAMDFFANHCKI